MGWILFDRELAYLLQKVYCLCFGLELALDNGAVIVGDNDLDVFELLIRGEVAIAVYESNGLFNINDLGACAVERENANGLNFASVESLEFGDELFTRSHNC